MAEQNTAPEADSQLKKRARRRLVGATALALFAVIVLPMVMDREPRPLSQDIQVRIPSQDSTGLTAKLLQTKPVATPMPTTPAPKAPTEPVVEPKEGAKAKPEPAAPISPPSTVAKSTSSTVVTPAAKTSNPTEKSAMPETKAEVAEKPAADVPGQWVVQLGAYKEAGNVKLLLSKLKGMGVPAFTEKYDSPQGPRTRVRAGPYPSQEAAEKARSKIKIVGVDGPVAPR